MNIHSAIQDAIKKCNLVFFVGAGFSSSLGLPNWRKLIEIIIDDLKKDYPKDAFINSNLMDQIEQGDLSEIKVLDRLKQKGHLPRMLEILEKKIGGVDLSKKGLSRHEKIWQITDQVVTTNYDDAFEQVLPDKLQRVVYKDSFHIAQFSDIERFLFKAHGTIERPEECVLFSDQYDKLYKEQTGAAFELFKLLSDKTIILLGFSLNDPYVNELLELRRKIYGGLKKNHFIITTDNRDFSEFGVERITTVNNYGADLDEFLEELVMIRDKYPYGLGMLIRGLTRQGKEFNIEALRKSYFDLVASLEEKPETAGVAEEVKAGEFGNAEEKLKAELEMGLQRIQEGREKAAEKACELAELKKVQLKYDEALRYFQQAVALCPRNPAYLNELGLMMRILGQYGKAIEYFQQTLAVDLEIYGDQHYEVARDYNNIGAAQWNLEEHTKAIEFYEKALAILQINGEQQAEVAICYNNIGTVWSKLGEHMKAIEFYDKALAIDLETNGEQHPNVAIRYINIGSSWDELGEYTTAIEFYEKALAIYLKIGEERQPEVAVCYNNIGSAWDELRDYKKAIEFYEKALAIDLELYGEQHPNVATRYNNIGFTWIKLNEHKKALSFYEKALPIAVKFWGEQHPNTQAIVHGLEIALGYLPQNNSQSDSPTTSIDDNPAAIPPTEP